MVLKVEMKLDDLPDALKKGFMTNVVKQEMIRGVAEGMVLTRNGMVQASPTGIGILRNSWVTDGPIASDKIVIGKVSSSEVQALVIDKGAQPHFPPIGSEPALAPWIRRKLGITDPKRVRGIAIGIGRKFARRGIPAKRTFTKAFLRVVPLITSRLQNAVTRITERLGRK